MFRHLDLADPHLHESSVKATTRRRAAIGEIYADDLRVLRSRKASTAAVTRSIASRVRSGRPPDFRYQQRRAEKSAMRAIDGYRGAPVRRRLMPGPISSSPGTVDYACISFSTSCPELPPNRPPDPKVCEIAAGYSGGWRPREARAAASRRRTPGGAPGAGPRRRPSGRCSVARSPTTPVRCHARRRGRQDARDLPAAEIEQRQLLLDIPLVVRERACIRSGWTRSKAGRSSERIRLIRGRCSRPCRRGGRRPRGRSISRDGPRVICSRPTPPTADRSRSDPAR